MKKNLKKKLLIILPIVLLLVVGAVVIVVRNNKADETAQTSTKKKVTAPVNIIDVSERPYLRLEPSADGHYITIVVEELKKDATSLDYEMEYQTGSMLQGFGGALSLSKVPTSEKKLFGSQSAGGAITYHEDIRGGNFLAEFSGKEDYAVKSAWRYFENSDSETEFTSQDAKLTISNANLAKYSYIVVYNSPGYPGDLKGELLSDVYTVAAEKSLETISSNFEVSFRSSEEGKIMGYDGSKWQEMDSSYSDGVVTASGAFMDTYVLVKS